MCPCSVTESCKIEGKKCQPKWPHLLEYDFPSLANDGLIDLVRWVANANLHYSFVDVCGIRKPSRRI